MALPASGSLSIKSAAGASRSISLEVDGNETGNKSLRTLLTTAGKTSGMTEFYSYSGGGTGCSAAPNVVSSVTANAVSNNVTVSWTPDSLGEDATQFRVERVAASDPGNWVFIANVAAGTGDSTTDNSLPSDQYQYRVRAENACGNSAYVTSNSVMF